MNQSCVTSRARVALSRTLLGAVIFAASLGSVNAVPITGDMGITGSFTANDTLDSATQVTLSSATGTSGTGDIGSTVGFGTSGTIGNGAISLAAFSPITNSITIGGWHLDLTSLIITDQTSNLLTLSGNGILSSVGFTDTAANWTFSSQNNGSSFSMTVTAGSTPASSPGSLVVLSIGLFGIVGRKYIWRSKS